jgi:hypothetical protein
MSTSLVQLLQIVSKPRQDGTRFPARGAYASLVGQRLIAHMTNGSSVEVAPSGDLDSPDQGWTEDLLANAIHDPHEWPHRRWWRAADGSWINVRHVLRIEVGAEIVRHNRSDRNERATEYAGYGF